MSKKNPNTTKDRVRNGFYRILALVLAGLMIAGTVTAVILYVIAK